MSSDTNADCLFCKIVRKEIPAGIVFEDGRVLAFRDINPKAPTHVLVIPKRHVAQLSDCGPADERFIGGLFGSVVKIARDLGLSDYRISVNNGASAGQVVFHVHIHLLAGRPFSWPPG